MSSIVVVIAGTDMAQRRMFSQRITNSAKFQQMQLSAQALYFHLGLAADDDGVVEAFTIMRLTKAADDDFRVLVAKEFIKPLNQEMVSYILDWNEHNLIRQDRIVPSMYRELLVQILPDVSLTEPKQRADRLGRPWDNHWTAQDRLGEGRVINTSADEPREERVSSEESERKPKDPPKYPHAKEVFALWPSVPLNWPRNSTQLQAAENLYEEQGIEEIQNALSWYERLKGIEFCPQINTPHDLDTKWLKLEVFVEKHS